MQSALTSYSNCSTNKVNTFIYEIITADSVYNTLGCVSVVQFFALTVTVLVQVHSNDSGMYKILLDIFLAIEVRLL